MSDMLSLPLFLILFFYSINCIFYEQTENHVNTLMCNVDAFLLRFERMQAPLFNDNNA